MYRAAAEAIQIAVNISVQNSSGPHALWKVMRAVLSSELSWNQLLVILLKE